MERNYSIGYLGRIHESKGIEYLIESFLSIKNTNYILQMGVERLQGNRCPNPLHRGMEVKGCTEG
jgi:hypothetical protein